MFDYLIVGCGIAGISFAETCVQNSKLFLVCENLSQSSSQVAAGIYNPVILKRFSGFNNAQGQLDFAMRFYKQVELRLNIKINFELPILRKFCSIEEQNDWFVAVDKPMLSPFLSLELNSIKYKSIYSPYDFGRVLQTGFIDTKVYLKAYRNYLSTLNLLMMETFNYNDLVFHQDFIEYRGNLFRNIVFAEGFGLHHNPFFNYLPLDGTKGELLIIKADALDLDVILNSSIYFVPLGNSLFKVGATYNWEDKTNHITIAGQKELINKIRSVLDCDFEIIEHLGGIRPTVKDRKPLVGTHLLYKRLHILNGLGTRGVLIGPEMAQLLYNSIENNAAIPMESNIERHIKYFK